MIKMGLIQKYLRHSKKGSSLATVIVLMAILMILAASYLDSGNYLLSSTSRLIGSNTTYIGVESASEKWFAILCKKIKSDPSLARAKVFDPSNPKQWVFDVLNDYKGAPGANFPPQIEILAENNAVLQNQFVRFEVYTAVRNGAKVTATVGILSNGDRKTASGFYINAGNRYYAQKTIDIPCGKSLKIDGPLNSVGDIYITGGGGVNKLNIKGNVSVFGTYLDKPIEPQQWLYGGLMAVEKAIVNVMGNVYSRAFVRTGKYFGDKTPCEPATADTSTINVTRDVFAQCIQTWSAGNQIYIYRNAYTLDDMECDGEGASQGGSVIGVNGSYIGLSSGDGADHDQSSAILNAAALHGKLLSLLSAQYSKSRVVVNGDLIIPGTIFKVDVNGISKLCMESAGIIYPKEEDPFYPSIPVYKMDPFLTEAAENSPGPIDLSGSLDALNLGYQKLLRATHGTFTFADGSPKNGYVNLFQVYAPTTVPDMTDIGNPGINNWKTNILATAASGANSNNIITTPTSISALSTSIVGANDSIYFDDHYQWANTDTAFLGDNGERKFAFNPSISTLSAINYRLDGFLPSEIGAIYRYPTLPTGTAPIELSNSEADENDVAAMTTDSTIHLTSIPTNMYNATNRFWSGYWDTTYTSPAGMGFDVGWYDYWQNFVKQQTNTQFSTSTGFKNIMDSLGISDSLPGGTDAEYKGRLGPLKNLVLNRLNKYSMRDYPAGYSSGQTWSSAPSTEIKNTFDIVASATFTDSIGDPNLVKLPADGSNVTYHIRSSGAGNDLATSIGPSWNASDYYVITNLEPKRMIQIDEGTNFKGVIITKGQVKILGGVGGTNITGAILACGKSKDDTTKSVVDTPNFLNAINPLAPLERDALENGDYSGIYVDLTNGNVDIDYFVNGFGSEYDNNNGVFGSWIARFRLLEKLNAAGINMNGII